MLPDCSNKKSFSIIGTAIILMVPVIFTGVLLFGQHLISNTECKKIISEFNYYEKAFHQFYNIYKTVPGNVDGGTCYLYFDTFTKDNIKACNWEQGAGYSMVSKVDNKKIVGSYASLRPYTTSMRFLVLAGLIDAWAEPKGTTNEQRKFENDTTPLGYANHNWFFKDKTHIAWYFPPSAYNENLYLSFAGFKNQTYTPPNNDGIYYGPKSYLTFAKTNEYDNSGYANIINDHNVILLKYLEAALLNEDGLIDTKTALDSKTAAKIDEKIDDGLPGKGKVLAFTTVDSSKYCYNQRYNLVNQAEYNKDDDIKYGCNMLYVMRDVKD